MGSSFLYSYINSRHNPSNSIHHIDNTYTSSKPSTGLYAEILQRNLGYFKKRGAQLQAASGGALEDKKISLVIFRGA